MISLKMKIFSLIFFFLIIVGYIKCAPIQGQSLEFRLIDCIPGENETLSKYLIEISNINETCIRVNKSSSNGSELFYYIAPQTDSGVNIQINTDDCTRTLPNLHLSLCDDDDESSSKSNQTEIMETFNYNNITYIGPSFIDNQFNNLTTETYPIYNEHEDEEYHYFHTYSHFNEESTTTETDSTSEEQY